MIPNHQPYVAVIRQAQNADTDLLHFAPIVGWRDEDNVPMIVWENELAPVRTIPGYDGITSRSDTTPVEVPNPNAARPVEDPEPIENTPAPVDDAEGETA